MADDGGLAAALGRAKAAGLDDNRLRMIAQLPADDEARAAGRDRDTVLDQMITMTADQAQYGQGPVVGEAIPQDVTLLRPSGEIAGTLNDFVQPGRPLVLNFGSCS